MISKRTRKLAFDTIMIIASRSQKGCSVIAYSQLSEELGVLPATGQGLGPILDEATRMCLKANLPNVSACVVTIESLRQGNPMPSDDSFSNGV